MNVSILIATYGEDSWSVMAGARAAPSADKQDAGEVLVGHDPSGTIASARNALAEKAAGDWLCFLDADDELAPGFLTAMERANRIKTFSEGEHVLFTPAVSYVQKGRVRQPRFLPGNDLRKNNYLVVGTLVQRDLFLSVGGFEDYPHGFEDWSLWAKCWKAGAKIVQVRRAVYIAHINLDSKHRVAWQDRRWQVEMHNKVAAELFGEGTG